jgi:capsular exopolysaccharide synthesis family protein
LRKTVNLGSLLSSFWWLIILFVVVIVGLFYFLLKDTPKTYSTATKVFVSSSSSSALADIYDAPYADRAVQTILALTSSNEIIKDLSTQTGWQQDSLKKSVKSRNLVGTQIIELDVFGSNQDLIVKTAKLYPEVLSSYLATVQTDTAEKDRIKITVAEAPDQVTQDSLDLWEYLVIVGFASLIVVITIIYLIEFYDSSVKSESEFEDLGIEHLGSFGMLKGEKGVVVVTDKKNGNAAEMLREIRTNITSLDKSRAKSIVVTSANPREGKTVFISSLGILLSESGKKVVIVDADLRSPFVHKVFKLSNNSGLADFLTEKVEVKDIVNKTDFENLFIITAGKKLTNPSESLDEKKILELKTSLFGSGADYIFFDSPPLGLVTDSAQIAKLVDGTIIVAEKEKTHKNDVKRVKDALDKAGAKILGSVLTKVRDNKNLYYYSNHD